MKKKSKAPKDFGSGIAGHFFDLSDHSPYNSIYNFIPEFAKEIGEKDETVREIKAYVSKTYRLNYEQIDEIFDDVLEAYTNIMFAIGFTLGQAFEVKGPEAAKEMAYIWKRMKGRKLFSVYPREKKAA